MFTADPERLWIGMVQGVKYESQQSILLIGQVVDLVPSHHMSIDPRVVLACESPAVIRSPRIEWVDA
jgi:hypothetical protein